MICRRSLLLVCLLLPARVGVARTPEAGAVTGAVALGPGFVAAPLLGGARALFDLALEGEYALDPRLSAVAELGVGLASTVPLRVRAGARYRLGGLGLPLSPFAQVQLGYARLFDVIGANLNHLSGRVGVGADYLLTARWAAGLVVAVDLGGTLGLRPAFYGTTDVLLRLAATL